MVKLEMGIVCGDVGMGLLSVRALAELLFLGEERTNKPMQGNNSQGSVRPQECWSHKSVNMDEGGGIVLFQPNGEEV